MVKQREVLEAPENARLQDQVKDMVGGVPVTHDRVKRIGADVYIEDAIGAVILTQQLFKV